MVGILEDLSPSGPSKNFDMEAFNKVMEAYVSVFIFVSRATMQGMLQKFWGQLNDVRHKEHLQPQRAGIQGEVCISLESLQQPTHTFPDSSPSLHLLFLLFHLFCFMVFTYCYNCLH